MFVYCLATVERPIRTYIGATIDLERRLRQHNGEIKGGARRTSARPGGWYRVCYVRGFTTWREALQFEWRWKYFSRSRAGARQGGTGALKEARGAGGPLELRQAALLATLAWWKERQGKELEVVAGELEGAGEAVEAVEAVGRAEETAPTDSEGKED